MEKVDSYEGTLVVKRAGTIERGFYTRRSKYEGMDKKEMSLEQNRRAE